MENDPEDMSTRSRGDRQDVYEPVKNGLSSAVCSAGEGLGGITRDSGFGT